MSALALELILPSAVQSQSTDNIPEINFQTVPITTAIEQLARMADLNYIIDPKVFTAADGSLKPEPVLTLHWQNYTAAHALARIMKENHLVMGTNAFTMVVRITSTNAVASPVDAKLLGNDAKKVIPMIRFMDVPLDQVLKSLIKQAQLSIVLDPQVSGAAPPQPPDFKMVMAPTVSVRWHDLTARQAIVEICEVYGLVIVKSSTSDSIVIKYRKQPAKIFPDAP